MNLEDLEYIFKKQLNEGTDKLYFMLVDGDYKLVERHYASQMEKLLPMLNSFQYTGQDGNIPKFTK